MEYVICVYKVIHNDKIFNSSSFYLLKRRIMGHAFTRIYTLLVHVTDGILIQAVYGLSVEV